MVRVNAMCKALTMANRTGKIDPWARMLLFWLVLIFSSVCFSTTGHCAGGDIIWQSGDQAAYTQEARAMALDSQGNVIVTGYQNGDTGNDDYLTVKFKADGSGVAWRATYDGTSGSDQATAVAVDANNDVIVTGFSWNGLNYDIHTCKYSGTNGELVWQQSYSGPAQGNDHATAISVDSLNNIYVGGYIQGTGGDDDFIILKYGPDGDAPIWQAVYAGPGGGNDQLADLTTGSDGIAVTGKSWNGTGFDLVTVMYDFAGIRLWTKRHPSTDAMGKKVRMDANDNVIVAGYATQAAIKGIYTAKYDGTNGSVIWEKSYGEGYENEANGLTLDSSGDAYITGYTWALDGKENYYTARYSGVDGEIVWQQIFDSGSGNTDVAAPLVLDEAGDLYVTGYTVADGIYHFQTIRYKRDNGNQLWQRSFIGPDNDDSRPVGIGLSPDGDVLVAGWTQTTDNDLDYYVVKYDNGALNQPGGLTANTLSSSSIRLDWIDNSSNEDGFEIERKLGELGSYAQIATVAANMTSYIDSGLDENNYYFYRVRAYSAANGDSHYSNEAHALTVFVNQISPAWTYTYANPDNLDDFANAIASGPDNNPVVTGFSQRIIGGFDYFTVKLGRSDRSIIWSDLYDDPDSEMDKATCIAVDSANNSIVSGFASLFFPPAQKNINSIYTLSYPPTGPPAGWTAQYNGPGGIDDRAVAIATATATDSSNSSIVVGHGKNIANNDDIYVIKYLANGTLSWSASPFDGSGGNDYANAVAIAADGSVYVAGYSETSAGSGRYNLIVAKYDGSSGALVWSDLYSPQAGGTNRLNGAAVDGAGDLYVSGYATNAAGNRDIYTIKYSGSATSAQRIWEKAFDGSANGDDEAIGVKIDPVNGDIIVAGTTFVATDDNDIAVLRYSAEGVTVWQKSMQRHDNDDHATALAMDSSGYIYIAGTTSNGASSDLIALIYDYEGVCLGITQYNGSANGFDEASSIAVNFLGEAFVAGYTTNSSGDADYLVLKQVNPFILVPAPLVITPQADYTKIGLSWGDNTPGTGFLIERTLSPMTGESVWTTITTATPGSTGFQDNGLNPNTGYCYRISAFSGSLFSRKIVGCATTVLPPPVMNPPVIVSATAIDLEWTNVSGNTGYKLERQAGNGAWTQIGGTLAAETTIFHDSGLTAGTVYYYRVSSISSSGTSVPGTVKVVPVLNAPTGITSARIDLAWPAVTGASGYRVERSSDGTNWVLIGSPISTATVYYDNTVESGVLYHYRLKVVTADGESIPSLTRTATSKLKTPAITSAFSSSTSQIEVAWSDPNSNETGYTLEYAACSSSYDNPVTCAAYIANDWAWEGWTQSVLAADSNTDIIGNLMPGRTYRFRVTAKLTGADSDASPMTTATARIVAPANLTATAATATTATLSWGDILGETNYRVLKDGVVMTGSGLPLAKNATSYTATGLLQNVQYCFVIQPYNAFDSADSNQACVTLYGPPTLTVISSVGQTQMTLNWSDVPGATGFEIWQSTPVSQSSPPADPLSGSWNAYVNLTPTQLPAGTVYLDVTTGLNAGYTYKYKIRYKLADSSFSPFSNELMETTVPPVPVSPRISSTTTSQVNFSWNDGYGETGYSVQQKPRQTADCSGEDWSGITSVDLAKNTVTQQVTGLDAGAVYCLRVLSYNGNGSSQWSAAITATTLLPAPVLNPLTDVTQSQITLAWSNVSGNSGYRIERSTNNVSWSQVTTVTADVVTYTNGYLSPNQIYYYRVSARNSAGAYSSPASNVESATTLAVTAPVLSPATGVTTSQISLNWNQVDGNSGYKLERSLDNISWSQLVVLSQGTTFYTNSGLTAGTLYFYRVSTKNSAGSYSAPSNIESVTTTPGSPAISAAAASESRIDISWQVVKGATNYKLLRSVGQSGPFNQSANLAVAYSTLYCGTDTLPSIACPAASATLTSHGDTGLAAGTEYCYRILAWNDTGGDSAASNTLCATTSSLNGPQLVSVTALNAMKIRLDWSYDPAACIPFQCEAAEGFQIWRLAPNGEWILMDSVANVDSYLDTTAIEPQKSYSYRVRALRGTDLSPFSNAAVATTPQFGSDSSTCP